MKKILLVAVFFLSITITAQDKTTNSIIRTTVTTLTKIKDKPDVFGKMIGNVDVGEHVRLLDYDGGYWLIDTGFFKGYISEVFLNVTPKMNEYKNRDSKLNAILKSFAMYGQMSDAAIMVKYDAENIYKAIVVNAKRITDSDTAFMDYINQQSRAYLFVNKYKHAKNYNDELMQTIIKKNTVPHIYYHLINWNIVAFDYNYETTGSAGF